jgi:multiple sugar transport system substrate-binding protein
VATQVTAYRADLVADRAPETWEGVARLSETRPVALSAAGPHAILNFFSLAVALGNPPAGEDLVEDRTAAEALRVLRAIASRVPAGTEKLNPIGLLEAMATGEEIALVPLVYGYVNYARPVHGRHAVAFADAPTAGGGTARGSVLGGTGIAITRRAKPDAALLDHLCWLMSGEVQATFIPEHDGQPSARAAWASPAVNAKAGGFYAATLATTEQAFVRPRHDGCIAFQTEASAIVRRAVFDSLSDAKTIAALRRAWRASRAKARGPLE